MNAEAFAMGEKMVFRSPNPSLHTVAHEAAHVIQQRAGARPSGGVGRVGDSFERHADSVAQTVVRGGVADTLLPPMAWDPSAVFNVASSVSPVQREIFIGKEPQTPSNFRELTTITGFGKSDRAGRKFSNLRDNPPILKNNAKSVEALDEKLTFDKNPEPSQGSDFNRSAILTAEAAKDLAPEVDHIVEKKDGGSTAKDNARVLSKGQNNQSSVDNDRPGAADTIIRVYRSYEADQPGEDPVSLKAGATLNFDQASLFFRFQTGRDLKDLNSFGGKDMMALAGSNPGEKNNVSVKEPGNKRKRKSQQKKEPEKKGPREKRSRKNGPRTKQVVELSDSDSG